MEQKAGKGFFIAKNYEEFKEHIKPDEKYTIQEFITGTRYYFHYFYSPLRQEGYRLSEGILEMLSMDRRVESNADEIFRLGSPRELEEAGISSYVCGHRQCSSCCKRVLVPTHLRTWGKSSGTVPELFDGMIGPFCLETVVTDKL